MTNPLLDPPVPVEEGGLMPSYMAACDLYRGDPQAFWKVGLGLLGRAAIIGAGVYVAGERDTQKLALYGLAGSAAVEAFVLGWVWKHGPRDGKA